MNIIGFIRFIVIFAIIYYLIKFIGKFILKGFIGNINKSNNPNYQRNNKKEGEVTIDFKEKKKKKIDKDSGDYIDYEEIK